MDYTAIGTGFIIGSVFIGLIIYLYSKSKFVYKKKYEDLKQKYQENDINYKVLESNYTNQLEKNAENQQKIDEREKEITTIRKELAILETSNQNQNQKVIEFKEQLEKLENTNQEIQQNYSLSKEKNSELTILLKNVQDHLEKQIEVNESQKREISELNASIKQLSEKYLKADAVNHSLTESLQKQKQEIEEIQQKARLEFEKIANKILEEKTEKFTQSNKLNIESILKPLGENIDSFRKKVEDTYVNEAKERSQLDERIKNLIEQTNKVSTEANNLASALKGQSKKQGDWGETILETILQNSGLEENTNYKKQETITSEEGKQLRPDFFVYLPENRVIIIDSKVSLNSYDRFSSEDDLDQQKIHLNEHIKSIKKHIDDLSRKKYDDLQNALDFTMMFIPIEPAYLLAIKNDSDLWNYAYKKRILLISPTNLIACLKLISDLWKRELQSKNAMEIVNRGEKMYEKFINFVETIEDLGKSIDKTNSNYQKAVKQLSQGSGNLINQAIMLKKLGLKSSKDVPEKMISFDSEE
ncbi:MAG: DNA recombination protein RmuC [Flavobacteriales bacterium]|nr:DNA recombination protein RmuC [Flavobacteriales bacterium]